ncbi:MAG: hypothetical protein BJ554DRAFT_2386 [Olpidium bornovanus]|uniref:Uncharacterized protein n=1 Tax=Olpidium bornovanus TaxID=278681 RepID=A0A8H7ZQX1_9FUNG|nr:MAG: hypothetical protein BJ554DRAFT_2386 [Olpidium bornovanus]
MAVVLQKARESLANVEPHTSNQKEENWDVEGADRDALPVPQPNCRPAQKGGAGQGENSRDGKSEAHVDVETREISGPSTLASPPIAEKPTGLTLKHCGRRHENRPRVIKTDTRLLQGDPGYFGGAAGFGGGKGGGRIYCKTHIPLHGSGMAQRELERQARKQAREQRLRERAEQQRREENERLKFQEEENERLRLEAIAKEKEEKEAIERDRFRGLELIRRAKEHSKRRVLRFFALQPWRRFVALQRKDADTADKKYTQYLIRVVGWGRLIQRVQAKDERVAQHAALRIMRGAWTSWKTSLRDRDLLCQHSCRIRNNQLTRRTFRTWQSRAKQEFLRKSQLEAAQNSKAEILAIK